MSGAAEGDEPAPCDHPVHRREPCHPTVEHGAGGWRIVRRVWCHNCRRPLLQHAGAVQWQDPEALPVARPQPRRRR